MALPARGLRARRRLPLATSAGSARARSAARRPSSASALRAWRPDCHHPVRAERAGQPPGDAHACDLALLRVALHRRGTLEGGGRRQRRRQQRTRLRARLHAAHAAVGRGPRRGGRDRSPRCRRRRPRRRDRGRPWSHGRRLYRRTRLPFARCRTLRRTPGRAGARWRAYVTTQIAPRPGSAPAIDPGRRSTGTLVLVGDTHLTDVATAASRRLARLVDALAARAAEGAWPGSRRPRQVRVADEHERARAPAIAIDAPEHSRAWCKLRRHVLRAAQHPARPGVRRGAVPRANVTCIRRRSRRQSLQAGHDRACRQAPASSGGGRVRSTTGHADGSVRQRVVALGGEPALGADAVDRAALREPFGDAARDEVAPGRARVRRDG